MKKALALVGGTLASAYAVAAALQLLGILNPGSGSGMDFTSRIVPVAIGGAVALACFQSAFKKDEAPGPEEGGG